MKLLALLVRSSGGNFVKPRLHSGLGSLGFGGLRIERVRAEPRGLEVFELRRLMAGTCGFQGVEEKPPAKS